MPRRSGRSGHDDTDWDTVLTLADRTSPYALAGSISGRYIKENMNPDLDWTYPFMGTEGN
ncbi:hypothetical protein [Streptomyces violaceusniger]|uniref:hypothetical protein n=1 Tax=Streptomyces violaceusniger TaxID=68280 RepID=UPI0036CBA35E